MSAVAARRGVLAANLRDVEQRIAAACADAGRSRDDVTLIAVTKTFPASDIRLLAELGIGEVGENRDQEASAKAAELADLALRWHFVGQLQTNKARSVARYADVVHSVDRIPLVSALARAAEKAERTLTCLIQIDLADPPQPHRGGAAPADVPRLADAVASEPTLRLGGVMSVAPLDADVADAFGALVRLCARVRADHAEATMVSAGMSHDLESAIKAGATHLRVGSALLGDRRIIVR